MRKILCLFGFHKWTCSIEDYIQEFGYVPLGNIVASNSKCSICNKKYKEATNEQI